jgi:WS/DGAT/MGAT family acyltransferase
VKAAGAFLSSSEAKKAGAPSEQGTGIIAGLLRKGQSLEQTARALIKKLPGGVSLGPRTPLNVAIGRKRLFVATRISLAETRAIAKHFDVKLNDVVLATCAGAIRRQYAGDKAVLAKSMIGAVPASLRAPGDTTQANLVTMMLVSLATNVKDPRKRLATIAAASARAKALVGGGMKGLIPTDLPSLGLPWLMSVIPPLYRKAVAANRIPVLANVAISNVPGPQVPLYMAGAQMQEYYPVSIVTHGLALNITILSYNGSLDYGLVACKQSMPGLRKFAANMQDAHRELLELAREPSPPPKVHAKKIAKRKPVRH